jgi:hypothetical protein
MGSAAGLPSDPTLKDATEGGSLTRPGPIGGPQSDAAAFPNALPQGTGTKMSARNIVKKRCRVSVPADQYPDYNFVGRLLGPRGATLKKLEKETGCKIMIRGKGSIRKDKENEVRGKPGWEHVFSEPLHVILEAEMEESQADYALERAKELVELLLIPVPEDRDTLKREQLRELAMLNGTLRQSATEHEIPTGASPMSGSAGTQGSDAQSGTQAGRRSRRSLSGAGGSFSGSRPGTITTASAEASLTNSEYRIFGMTGSLGNMRLADMNSWQISYSRRKYRIVGVTRSPNDMELANMNGCISYVFVDVIKIWCKDLLPFGEPYLKERILAICVIVFSCEWWKSWH